MDNKDTKLENTDFDLFKALNALDKKDYGYYDRLTEEQQKKFVPFMMVKWFSYVNHNRADIEQFYVLSTNEFANKFLFNDTLYNHPKLVWLLLCAASPKLGTMKRSWIPQIREKVSQLKDESTKKEIVEYYTKIYPNADKTTIDEVGQLFLTQHKKKLYLAQKYPNLKHSDIETLSNIITDQEIENNEREYGND